MAAQKILLKRNPANIRKWIAQFFISKHLYLRWKRVCVLTIIAWVAHRYRRLYLLLINMLLEFLPVVLHGSQPLSGGKNNPIQRCHLVGGGCVIHAESLVASLTDRLLWCATDDDQRQHHHRRASFSALAHPANSFVYFAHQAQHPRWPPCRPGHAFASFSSLAFFIALGFMGNGVITVMISSPWQADDDADNQSGDNRSDSAHTSISLTVPPTSLIFAIRLSALCSRQP